MRRSSSPLPPHGSSISDVTLPPPPLSRVGAHCTQATRRVFRESKIAKGASTATPMTSTWKTLTVLCLTAVLQKRQQAQPGRPSDAIEVAVAAPFAV
jgi:hypothetical protein